MDVKGETLGYWGQRPHIEDNSDLPFSNADSQKDRLLKRRYNTVERALASQGNFGQIYTASKHKCAASYQ